MVGRFFIGVFCGLFSGVLPMYLSECPPKNLKGLAGTLNQLGIVFGVLFVNVFGLPGFLGSKELWPVLCGIMLIIALSHIGLLFTVESPKYLFINKNNREQARLVLLKLRNYDEAVVNAEIEELAEEKEKISNTRSVTWGDMFTSVSLRRALLVTVVIQMSQQLSGK
jgi:SP family facilitated glucose transporter-like MFS transporter 1